MMSVVSGSATIKPMKPSKAPQIESDRSIMAGLSPMDLPIILGVRKRSCVACTTIYTSDIHPTISQKLPPVDTELTRHRSVAMGIDTSCK